MSPAITMPNARRSVSHDQQRSEGAGGKDASECIAHLAVMDFNGLVSDLIRGLLRKQESDSAWQASYSPLEEGRGPITGRFSSVREWDADGDTHHVVPGTPEYSCRFIPKAAQVNPEEYVRAVVDRTFELPRGCPFRCAGLPTAVTCVAIMAYGCQATVGGACSRQS